jgi:hypothetical protein
MRIAIDTTLQVELEGDAQAGLRERQHADGVWEPGEAPSIQRMRVMLVRGSKRLDITAWLTDDKLRELEEEGLELHALND